MNRWTVLLLLVLARLLISLNGLNTNIVTARARTGSACTKVEDVGSAIASMPYYLSAGVNRLAADGITKAVQGLVEILLMILTGAQQLIMFFIEIEVGIILCFSTAIARAVLEVGEFAVKGATEALNAAIKTVLGDLSSAASGISHGLDDIKNKLKQMPGVGSIADSIPDTSGLEYSLNKLNNPLPIDTDSLLSDLEAIEKNIDYDNVKNVAKEAIAVPFDMVKRLLNESYGTWQFDHSVFPIPAKESMSFCSDSTLEDFFEVLSQIAANAKIIGTVVLIALAVLACAVMAWWEIKRFRKQLHKSEIIVKREPMEIVYIAGRPLTAGTGLWLSEKLSTDRKRQLLIRWVIAYATTYTALFVLALSVAGAFSCLCQWIIMRAVQQEVPALAATVGDFAGDVVTSLEQASSKWANDSNGIILGFQGDINDKMFGHVRNATHAANDTISKFDNAMHEGLSKTFGGVPPLENFLNDIINCLIGNKLESVQEGLAWVNENARVTLPLFPIDVFSIGTNDSTSGDSNATTFLFTPSSSVTDEITDAVDSVVDMLWISIIQEVATSLVLFLIYLAYVFFAAAQAAICMAMGDR
ncbi:putative plasma membrane fusion protein prm1 [Diaporthe ampelina]|uniref:Plasma membrane fusion protein PRM1 n=1 Tax=Diaporthe ampelina TaxID=1214573 RepID=A0A0G2H7M9_9PEZI|nr:putative plasma membrane fusion protein prm1 [Diaporthe ampelina]